MTKSEIMKMAHAEARTMKNVASYREAVMFGLRRAHNKAQKMAIPVQAETPKFMFLRGL